MDKLYIDFESYSKVNIKLKGGMNYMLHPSTQPICLGYALNDEPPEIWTPAIELPEVVIEHVKQGLPVFAHSDNFDYRLWNYICTTEFGWPALSLNQMVDTMALCLTYTVRPSLADAGEILGITLPKHKDGTRLIKLCCCPMANGQQPTPWGSYAEHFRKLFRYCKGDVDAMRQVVNKLPRQDFIPKERKIWQLTVAMNTRGLPVDFKSSLNIKTYVSKYADEEMLKIPKLCDYAFDTVNQVAKLRAWVATQGYIMDSVDAAAVSVALEDPSCPDKVKAILKMRQEFGRSSTAKYTKLLDQAVQREGHHFICDGLLYHGANPGRWTGRGFQMHNLPRASVLNPEEYIEQFNNGQEVEDPVTVAKALIRPMICAPEGESLLVADYNSIENRVLHWIAGDTEECDNFRKGIDQYKTMASSRYHVLYDDVTKPQRQMGKVIILGCGYGMGWETFVETAKAQFKMEISPDEAKESVKAYRDRYPLVVKLWRELKLAATRCVMTGERQTYGLITFGLFKANGIKWLAMLLPSGKSIYYMDPGVTQAYIPKYEHMGKVPTITHMGFNSYARRWCRVKLIPGRITENAVQGTAREIMAQGMLNVDERLRQVTLVGTVHDEAISRIMNSDITDTILEEYSAALCDIPWAKDCPISADGYIAKRYRKE